jgi:hypothetical protein
MNSFDTGTNGAGTGTNGLLKNSELDILNRRGRRGAEEPRDTEVAAAKLMTRIVV